MVKECWLDGGWNKDLETRDDEIWSWVYYIHPTYFPFDELVPWISEDLVAKYEDKAVERPEWMVNENEVVKRIVEVFKWKGKHEEVADEALMKLFRKSSADLEFVERHLYRIKKRHNLLMDRALTNLLSSCKGKRLYPGMRKQG